MALSAKLIMRQGQSLVMTPQLLQAIKLLQFSNHELSAFIEEELERNPLLERAEDGGDPAGALPAGEVAPPERDADRDDGDFGEPAEADWSMPVDQTDADVRAEGLVGDADTAFGAEAVATPGEALRDHEPQPLGADTWTGAPASSSDGEPANLEAYVAAGVTLGDHLAHQLALSVRDSADRLVGHALIDSIDAAGYLNEELAIIAARLGAPLAQVERILAVIHTFEPTGIGARDLAECLAIQLRERDRLDPAMQAMLTNLPLVARRDFAALRKLCGVDDADIVDMIAEIRTLEPKPARAFGAEPVQPVVADVIVRTAADGSWHIELNADVLPRVLVNQTYAARVSKQKPADGDKSFVSNCLQTANWLTKSLEQRARTILKVASEIVRQQDAFFAHGVAHLRPLNLRAIADAIGMHESTVSRVTSNKYMSTPRGLFELKYFFTASIATSAGGEAHSAEAVRFKIKQLIDSEKADRVLSDDAIVLKLKDADIMIARRTVAKYRDSLRIPSSAERRREKQVFQGRRP